MNEVLPTAYEKKYPILLLIFAVFFVLIISSGSEFSQVSKRQLKNKGEIADQSQKELDKAAKLKVKTRNKYATFYKRDGKLWDKKTLVEKVTFGTNGLCKEHIMYSSLGAINSKFTYTYDAMGNMISSTTFDSQKKTKATRESVFDKNGNEIERKIDDGKNPGFTKMLFTYDTDGNLIETKIISKDNQVTAIQTISYVNGLKNKVISKDANSKVAEEINASYDASGRLVIEEKKNGSGSVVTKYKYDNNGNMIEMANNQWKRYMSYNTNGDLLEDKLYLPDGSRQFRVCFNYNSNRLQNEEIRYDTQDKPAFYTKYVYEFYK